MATTDNNKTLVQKQADVQAMKNSAADTAYNASQLDSKAFTLNDTIMESVRKDRQSRGMSTIASDVGQTMGQLVSDPEGVRDRTRGIVDPNQVNALTADARATNMRTLGEQSTQQQLNQGSLDEIIQAGANTLKERAANLMAQAQMESDKADSLMESLKFEQSEKERQFSEWLSKEQLSDSRAKSSGSGSGGPGGEGDASAWAAELAAKLVDDATKDEFWSDYALLREQGYSATEIQTILGSRYGGKVKKPEVIKPKQPGILDKLLQRSRETTPSGSRVLPGPLPFVISPPKGDLV